MNLNDIIKLGEVLETEFEVKESDTAHAAGNIGVKVLSTPALLRYVENGASTGLFQRLPKEYSPLGTKVELNHIAATPVNEVIKVISKVTSVGRSRVSYDFEVYYKDRLISNGVYEQAVVVLEDFLRRNNAL